MDLIPKLHDYYDEPFADPSQLPTCLVSAMARQNVTVSLSGDGGDELFAGYRHYSLCSNIWRYLSMVPTPVRNLTSEVLYRLPRGCLGILSPMFPAELGRQIREGRSGRIAQILASDGPDDLYRRVVSQWIEPKLLLNEVIEYKGKIWDNSALAAISDFIPRMQYYDSVQYLPDDILTKVDRASMAVSLETRLPLLDYRIFEFAWRLPMSMKLGVGGGKLILRELLSHYLPAALFERPKKGFGVPQSKWLKSVMKDRLEEAVESSRTSELFEYEAISKLQSQHLNGTHEVRRALWNYLFVSQFITN